MARRLWLPVATLLILPVLVFGLGRPRSLGQGSDVALDSLPEPGLIEAGGRRGGDRFECPVCNAQGLHSQVERSSSKTQVHQDRRYHLCSGGCLEQFRKNPAYFLAALAERLRGPGAEAKPEEKM